MTIVMGEDPAATGYLDAVSNGPQEHHGAREFSLRTAYGPVESRANGDKLCAQSCQSPGSQVPSFRQIDSALDTEVCVDSRRCGIRLAAADADGVIALGDERMPVRCHHPQIAVL